jgi:hypothetical protein
VLLTHENYEKEPSFFPFSKQFSEAARSYVGPFIVEELVIINYLRLPQSNGAYKFSNSCCSSLPYTNLG